MAHYTRLEVPSPSNWLWNGIGLIGVESASASEIVLVNQDGTRTHLLSAAGNLTHDPVTNALGGDVSGMTRTDASGATVYETIVDANVSASTFILDAQDLDFMITVLGGDDTMDGWPGMDDLRGYAGNDIVNGGAGDDFIEGGEGDDTLSGGEGDDTIFDFSGVDHLTGGAGNDVLYAVGGSTLEGGDGNDILGMASVFPTVSGPMTFLGGAGDDRIFSVGETGDDVVDAGSGDDTVALVQQGVGTSTITLGEGRDRISYIGPYREIVTLGIVTDFATGPGGDVIDLAAILNWTPEASPDNPFGPAGCLRFVQDGADALLQFDADGAGVSDNSFVTILRFQNTSVGSFTFDNFDPPFPPDGGPAPDLTIIGTEDADTLTGASGNDTIDGLGERDVINGAGGNDTIFGRGGNDDLGGNDGNDTIHGGADNDFLRGNAGADTLYGDEGTDTVRGGSGNDWLDGGSDGDSLNGDEGDDTILGGDGDDNLTDGAGDDAMYGGAGNDRLIRRSGVADLLDGGEGADQLFGLDAPDDTATSVVTLIGGSGDDQIDNVGGRVRSDVVDAGQGDDTVSIWAGHLSGVSQVTLGAGRDIIISPWTGASQEVAVVTDFVTGPGGDKIGIEPFLHYLGGNPFGPEGNLRLFQDGADTLLQIDPGGSSYPGNVYMDLIRFENTQASSFTADNLTLPYDPQGGITPGQTINGTSGDDELMGTVGGDTISGGNGNDAIYARDGDDTVSGGNGNDMLEGEEGNDTLSGGNGNDELWGRYGHDALTGGNGDDFLDGGDGNDTLDGGNGNDYLNGDYDNDVIRGGNGDDFLEGYYGDDLLYGGNGADQLHGAAGNDVLTGGAGSDTFHFHPFDEAHTRITDFQVSGPGHDVLFFYGLFQDIGEVAANSVDTGDGLLITLGETQTVLVENTTLAELQQHPEDLLFV